MTGLESPHGAIGAQRTRPQKRRAYLAWVLGALTAGGILALDWALPLGVAGGVPYVALVLLSSWSTKQRDTFIAAAAGTILTGLGYILSDSAGVEPWMVLLNRGLALFAIWTAAVLLFARRRADTRSRETLLQSERHFRALIEQAPYEVWLHDLAGGIVEVNRRSCDTLGLTRAELLRMKMSDIDHGPEGGAPSPDLAATLAGESTIFESRYSRQGGELFPVEIHSTRLSLEGRELILSCAIDITERKLAEAALRASEEKFRSVVQSIDDGVITTDSEGTVTLFSKGAERAFGYTAEEVLGRSLAPLMPAALREQHRAAIERVGRTGKFWVPGQMLSLTGLRKDGSEFPFELSFGLWRSDGAVCVTGIVRDVTERMQIEDKNRELEEHYRQTRKEESIGRLAGGVAHDLNNLLTPILGYSELMMKGMQAGDAHHESVEQIQVACSRARDLVGQLLAFSRKQTLDYIPVEMHKAVIGIEKLLRRTIPEDIEFELNASPETPTVMADVGQIEQVIMNLVVNAADAMPEGGRLTIETASAQVGEAQAATHPELQPGEYARLAVSDTGCGMEGETLEQLFEPFYSTKGELGTGLGLATVHGIVRQHGGSISVSSEPGCGTTFTAFLPVSDEAPAAEDAPREVPATLEGTETIVLVEDNDQVRGLAHAILVQHGYNVLLARDGAEALPLLMLGDRTVHLLLTDVVMPEMNGKELYLRALVERPSLKVLYMSGYTDSVIADRGVLEEGIAFLAKPFTITNLLVKVRGVLD